jgi:putative aldouronate transport system permease protein
MWNYGKKSTGSKVFDICNVIFLILVSIVTIYPFVFVLFASLSDPVKLMAHSGILWHPLGFTLGGYVLAFKTDDIINGYGVTAFLVIVGTACNLAMTMLFAYVISRRGMMWSRFLTIMVIITMYFSGGMIPSFLVVKSLGLYDSLWSLILPNLISTYLLIIMRTSIMGVPVELEESAKLDGAGELKVLLNIIMPAIVPTLAALGLFYAVGYWNSWANALVYIKTTTKYPLQMVLRMILIQNNSSGQMANSGFSDSQGDAFRRLMKYSTVIISIVPIMLVYPFIQKYFTTGLMIGALKG